MHTHIQLQALVLKKLNLGPKPDRAIVRYHAIHQLATKPNPLTEDDVQMLKHYLDSNNKTLNNTIYHANSIINPVTTDVKQHIIKQKQL
jgi:hypothetical protein